MMTIKTGGNYEIEGTVIHNQMERSGHHEGYFRLFAELSYDWETLRTSQGHYIYVSPSSHRITGYKPEAFYQDSGIMMRIIHPEWHDVWKNHEHSILKDGELESIDFKIRTVSGEEKWIRHICQAVKCQNPCITLVRSSNTDVSHRKELERMLEDAAMRDPLTRLMNRRFFMESLKIQIHQARRSGEEFSLILGDIDNFKGINDSYGHECGDRVLVQASRVLTGSLRSQDIISRWGGEEFLILLPGTRMDQAVRVAEKLRDRIAAMSFLYNENRIHLTMSFGVHGCNCETNPDDCIRKTDFKLLQAKRAGKNRVV